MEVLEQDVVADRPRRPRLLWGPIFAGLFLVLALGWLLTSLGGALGFTVVDATDMEALGDGFTTTAAIWVGVSALIAYFVGGLLVARLADEPDRTRGALQGLTLWSVATVLTLALGFLGVRSLMTAGVSVVQGAASLTADVARGGGQVVQEAASGLASLADTELVAEVRGELEDDVEEALAQAESRSGESKVTAGEVDRALEGLDAETLESAAADLASGDTEGARRTLREATGMDAEEVDSLVQGVTNEMQESWNESETAQAIEASFREGVRAVSRDVAAAGGSGLSAEEVREAFSQIDGELLAEVSRELIAGRTGAAERALTRETTLEQEDVEALVASASETVDGVVATVRDEAAAAAETASDYTEAVLWTWWVGALLALVACVAGGVVGASAVERIREHRVVRHATV